MPSKPRKSAIKSKSPPKTGSKAKAGVQKKRTTEKAASQLIDERIQSLDDWRGERLAEIRRVIHDADPEIVEECKWVKPTNPLGVPVWSHAGIVCTGETYKDKVKLTFAKGAALADPSGLFNSSLAGNTRRAIDIRETETLDVGALADLIRAAVVENLQASKSKSKSTPKTKAKPDAKGKPVKLLSGGNPQIAKAEGDAPVQAYIAAMPGWKSDLGRRLDELIERTVPGVHKAVKWNSPLYGIESGAWFLSYHCFTKYVKVTFFRGKSLRPVPPGTSKHKDVRYLDIREDEEFDEAQFADWVKQASELPGERM